MDQFFHQRQLRYGLGAWPLVSVDLDFATYLVCDLVQFASLLCTSTVPSVKIRIIILPNVKINSSQACSKLGMNFVK